MTDDDIVFEDPPAAVTTRVYDWPKFARAAKRRPNEWIKVFEGGPHSVVTSIKSGHNSTLSPSEGFEVTTRNNHKDGGGRRMCTLYLRFVPPSTTTEKKRSSKA